MEKSFFYYEEVMIAMRRAGVLKWFLLAGWIVYPVLVQTVAHPTDAAGFWHWLNGQRVPGIYSVHELFRGEITAVMALIAVSFVYLVVTALFYRRTQFWVALWPVAALVAGIVGNGGWWLYYNGVFDATGVIAGFMPTVLTGVCVGILHQLGADFVFGRDNRPSIDPATAEYQ